MGAFDTYRDGDRQVQIKTNNAFDVYELHQSCPLEDGVYIGHEGAVAVRDSKVVGVFENIFTKWGGSLSAREILFPHDEVAQAVDEVAQAAEPFASTRSNDGRFPI